MGKATVVAEIGANHGGSLDTCLQMLSAAAKSGADYAKVQKRDLDLSIPDEQKGVLKETPWGLLSYYDYRRHLEFERDEFDKIAVFCGGIGLPFFGSAWDIPSAEFLLHYNPAYLKVPSAKITDLALLRWIAVNSSVQSIISTGMSTMDEVRAAVRVLPDTIILHCNSTYPCPPEDLNLNLIRFLKLEFPSNVIGYSGHEVGLATTVAAVAMGAEMVERHLTLDRASWGTDQAASVEPNGFARMVKDIRLIEKALGDGIKRITAGEIPIREKLRGVPVGTAQAR
jgi:N-acetylneuraminate synthase